MSDSKEKANFYLWGSWKSKTIKIPFLTKKVAGDLKKVVMGDTFIVALKENGDVVSWGKDTRNGCLGLGESKRSDGADAPETLPGLSQITDIQMGTDHLVALNTNGEVFCWGKGDQGQLGTGDSKDRWVPTKVDEGLQNEQIMQIAVIKNSTFALSTTGLVFGWGDNKNNVLGLSAETTDAMDGTCVWLPTCLTSVLEWRVRKIEVFNNRTIIAHVRESSGDNFTMAPTEIHDDTKEVNIFQGISVMRDTMDKLQEWWNHLVAIKYGQPYDNAQDLANSTSPKPQGDATIAEDRDVEPGTLKRAHRHLESLLKAAINEYKNQSRPGSRNVKFVLCMFIDECRLRREKVQRLISSRELEEVMRGTRDIPAYSVIDLGHNSNEEVRKIVAVTIELQKMRDHVKLINPSDHPTELAKRTLLECLEAKLLLHDTRLEVLKASEGKTFDPMLPALRIIKDRWNRLKQFSLYSLYLEQEQQTHGQFVGNDDKYLAYLVEASNLKIDAELELDKDRIFSHDTLVPALCYDLLKENAELRKKTNSYQLQVLLLHDNKNLSSPKQSKPFKSTKGNS
uniref:Uncharacterized protein n=1 Tax=Noctiluca scintillans TaxID=2966 RepID=A0A7S1A998_NOCSC